MKRLMAFVLTALLLLSGCGGPAETIAPPVEPDPLPVEDPIPPEVPAEVPMEERQEAFLAFLEGVNASRRAIYESGEPIQADPAWTPDLTELTEGFTEKEIAALLTAPKEPTLYVTAQEGREDVETAFRLLKHSYGAYDYFGGDEVFLPLRDEILADLPQEEEVSVPRLEQTMAEKLAPVLVDGHFRIGNTPMRNLHAKYMYYVPRICLESAEEIDPAIIKPSVDDKGRLCYRFAALVSPEEAKDLPRSVEVDGETVKLAWIEDRPKSEYILDVFSEAVLEDSTPLLTSRAMYFWSPRQKKQIDRLAECGGEYADTPVLIFDVRANGGGNDQYINQWFEGYTGQRAEERSFYSMKFSATNRRIYQQQGNAKYYGIPDDPAWQGANRCGTWIERDGLSLILQDKGTASSGETVVEHFRTLANTLFLGSETLGCNLVSNNINFYLPHSGLNLYFGTGLTMKEETVNREGVGYLPDLWVPSARALDLAEKMITYYDLNVLMDG